MPTTVWARHKKRYTCSVFSTFEQAQVMSRRTRTLIGIVVIELLLAGGWIWLHGKALTSPHATRDSTRS